MLAAERVRLITQVDRALRELAEFEDQVVRTPQDDDDYLRAFDQHDAWIIVPTDIAVHVAKSVDRASQIQMHGDLRVYDPNTGGSINYEDLSLLSFHADETDRVNDLIEERYDYLSDMEDAEEHGL